MMRMKKMIVFAAFLAAVVLCVSNATLAATVAYYEFEEGADGAIMANSNGRTGPLDTTRTPGYDSSGNGNTIYAWTSDNWGKYRFSSNVPAATVPQTGAANTRSIHNNHEEGAWWPVMTTYSALTAPSGIDLESTVLSSWTMEASFVSDQLGGYQDMIGHTGIANPANADSRLYLQKINSDQCRIAFVDNAGNEWDVVDPNKITSTTSWYQIAASSDGRTLTLYDNVNADGTAGALHLVGTRDISTSTDTSLYHQGDNGWYMFGAGQWNNGDTDRLIGSLDSVRISNTALGYDELLCVPEPSTIALLVIAGVLGLLYKRNRK
jgi:hypothetical protein